MIPRFVLLASAITLAATVADAQITVTPEPAPERLPDIHKRVDSLPPADVKQAIDLLKANYLHLNAFSESELDRAMLQGILSRITPGGQIIAPAKKGEEEPAPFRSEILDARIGYLRMGSLSKKNIEELDSALKNFTTKSLKSVILDLRATPPGNDFDLAAEVTKRFAPKGRVLFTIKKPSTKEERVFTSDREPAFHGLLIVLSDKDTAGTPEVVLAALRTHARAMIVGQTTAGQAAEFADMPLPSGKVLRIAIAEITLPDTPPIFPRGIKPDVAAEMPDAQKEEVMRLSLEQGVDAFVFDTDRPHMNEAALVAGTNPELDALQAAQKNKSAKKKVTVHDTVIQHAVDLILSIDVFESRAQK